MVKQGRLRVLKFFFKELNLLFSKYYVSTCYEKLVITCIAYYKLKPPKRDSKDYETHRENLESLIRKV